MRRSQLGQTTTTTTVYRPVTYGYGYPGGGMPMGYPYPYPGVAPGGYPAAMSSSFARSTGASPDQPYKLQLTSEQIEQEVYKALPSKKKLQAPEGTTPQTVVKTESGLVVPKYILERAKQREKAEKARAIAISLQRPPLFHKVGTYATESPGMAAILALAFGAAAGTWYYDYKQSKVSQL